MLLAHETKVRLPRPPYRVCECAVYNTIHNLWEVQRPWHLAMHLLGRMHNSGGPLFFLLRVNNSEVRMDPFHNEEAGRDRIVHGDGRRELATRGRPTASS